MHGIKANRSRTRVRELGIESALYSILTYFAASKTVSFIIHGIEEYTAITIISDKNAEIKDAIIGDLNRGVTAYKGNTYTRGEERDILHCVVTRLEIGIVKSAVKEIDASAFIITHPLAEVEGGIIKKTILH